MKEIKARLFNNGRSQAIRIPAEFRFVEREVYIRKDPLTGDVILSRKPTNWNEFFTLLDQTPEAEKRDFLKERDLSPPVERESF